MSVEFQSVAVSIAGYLTTRPEICAAAFLIQIPMSAIRFPYHCYRYCHSYALLLLTLKLEVKKHKQPPNNVGVQLSERVELTIFFSIYIFWNKLSWIVYCLHE